MKQLRGDASAAVAVPGRDCFAVLRAVEDYPRWYPDVVSRAEVLERGADALPTLVQTVVHLGLGPLHHDFRLVMRVDAQAPGRVCLARVPNDPSDEEELTLAWYIGGSSPTELRLEVRARLDVPALLPVRGAGDSVARGFLSAACRELKRSHRGASSA